jgi:hypothetical protein
VLGAAMNLPIEQFADEYLSILKNDPNFYPIGEFVSGNGKKVWVYSKAKK